MKIHLVLAYVSYEGAENHETEAHNIHNESQFDNSNHNQKIGENLEDEDAGRSFEEHLNNPNTTILVPNFKEFIEWVQMNPEEAAQVLLSTTNCIDGRPVMLHNSGILLLRFLQENNGIFNKQRLEEYISDYLADPIRKTWYEEQDKRKVNKEKIMKGITETSEQNQGFKSLQQGKLGSFNLTDMLTEGSGYPGGGLGFLINYTDMLAKNRNDICEKLEISREELKEKIEGIFKKFGSICYYHSCDGNFGGECKYDGCAAIKYFMHDQSIDSGVQVLVKKYVLDQSGRKSTILNGKHNEENRITIVNPADNNIGIGARNDVSTKNDLGSTQSFVLNLQLEKLLFSTVTSVMFEDKSGNANEVLRELCTTSLLTHLGNINPKLGAHKIEHGTVITENPKDKTPAIRDIGTILNNL
jgi:hypothetical protein